MSGRMRVLGRVLVSGWLLAACSSSDDPGRGSEMSGASGSGGSDGSDDSGAENDESCVEHPLFPAEAHGDNGADMIRAIQVDQAGGKLIVSDLEAMFELPRAGGKPSLLGSRPSDAIYGDFWLKDDQLLFPAGFATPIIEEQRAVLFSTDRAVQTSQVVVGIPAPQSLEWQYEVGDVRVAGDFVYWVARDKHTDRPSDLLPPWDTSYAVRRTSWRTPSEPVELYSSKHELDDLVIAANLAFVSEKTDADSSKPEQRVIDLTNETVLTDSAQTKFGGRVVAGDGTSLFISKLELEPPYEVGVFRVGTDGTGKTLLTTNPFVSDFTLDGDTWVYTEGQSLSEATLVWSYRVGEQPKRLGCIGSSATIHALTASDSKAYVAIYRDDKTTILEFAR